MRADRQRWDEKYARGNPNSAFVPDPQLAAHAHWLGRGGVALDIACGVGHNTLFLAAQGHTAIGLDTSIVGMQYGRAEAKRRGVPAQFAVVDLDEYAPARACADAIVVIRYLRRPLIPLLKTALKPSGVIYYRTFNRNHLAVVPSFNPEYLLAPGELRGYFDDLELLATNDALDTDATETFWIGRRIGASDLPNRNAGLPSS